MTVIENSSTKDDSFPLGLGYLMLREVCTAYPNEIEKFLTD